MAYHRTGTRDIAAGLALLVAGGAAAAEPDPTVARQIHSQGEAALASMEADVRSSAHWQQVACRRLAELLGAGAGADGRRLRLVEGER